MKIGEEKIVEVAYRLFKEKGVRLTRLQEVAKSCGISLYDINLIFPSKKDLVLTVIKQTLDKKTAYLLINSSLSPSAVTELSNFFKFIEDSIADLGVDIFNEIKRYQPNSLDQLQELVDEKLTPYLQRNMERGLNEGFYRDNLDSHVYAETYFFFLRRLLESYSDWNETKRAITHMNDIYRHGVLNVKGMRV
jgi:AcrR family transcriptional regulator